MNTRTLLLAVPLLLAASLATAQPAPQHRSGPKPIAPSTPTAAIRSMAQAYNNRSVHQLDGLLTADYRFHFSAGDSSGGQFINGFDRSHDLQSAQALFEGYRENGVQVMAPAKSIKVTVGDMEEGPDPEHPDSLLHYRVVVVHNMAYRIVQVSGEKDMAIPADEIFYVARADVANRTPSQAASPTRWYIRRWMEDVHAFERSLATTDGHCEEAAAMPAEGAAGALGVRALDSPLCPTLEVVCDLPRGEGAVLEVFDVQGRRLAHQDLRVSAPGALRVQAGSGTRFAPGAYWLRLSQGHDRARPKMVIVAR